MTTASYAVDVRPPWSVALSNAIQQMGVTAPTLVYPLLVAEAVGLDAGATAAYLDLAMIAIGIGCLLQSWPRLGCGFLVPSSCTGAYFAPVLIAAHSGGLGAVAGMTMAAGVTEMLLSLCVRRLRPYLPTEITGLVILLIGMLIGLTGLRQMTGIGAAEPPLPIDLGTSIGTLAIIVGVSIWGSARLRTVATLLAIVAGTVANVAFRINGGLPWPPMVPAGIVGHAWPMATPGFMASLLPGFVLGGVVNLLRVSGDIVLSQRVNDPHWRRPDYANIQSGVLADGLATFIGGLIGGVPVNSSSAGVGLAVASGVLSRRVGSTVGVLWIGMGLLPGGASMIMAIPHGVLGAVLLYSGAFVVVGGMNIITQRLLDARRTFTIGAAFVIGLSYDELPALYRGLSPFAQTLLPSSLLLALSLALVLNAVFRVGAGRAVRLAWRPEEGRGPLEDFITEAGEHWGARVEPIHALARSLGEFGDVSGPLVAEGGVVEVVARFDEYNLNLTLRWPGLTFPQPRPASFDDVDDPLFAARLAAAIIAHQCDRMTRGMTRDGRQELAIHLDH